MNWYQENFVETGRSPAVWALVTIAETGAVTRRIQAKKADSTGAPGDGGGGLSDIYIRGACPSPGVGILLVLVAGLLEFRFNPETPWAEVLATVFGIGAALTLDEFALWFHRDDVYWGEEAESRSTPSSSAPPPRAGL